jgi:hypothetical protein
LLAETCIGNTKLGVTKVPSDYFVKQFPNVAVFVVNVPSQVFEDCNYIVENVMAYGIAHILRMCVANKDVPTA